MTTSLANRIGALQAGPAAQLPDAVRTTFATEQAELRAAGVPAGVATTGSVMPDGDLLDTAGAPTSLATVRAGRRAVVVLYRGAWCPFCNVALRAYEQDLVPALAGRDVVLIAVSPQRPDGSLSMAEKNALTYAVVSDPGNQIARGLGVLTGPSQGARDAQAQLGLDVAAVNADGTAGLPMPTVVVVEADGTIGWIDVHPDYTTRTEPAEIVAAL